jgi:hypothetical protein
MKRSEKPVPPPDPADDGLPANIEAERFVLGSVLLDAGKHLATARAALSPDDFKIQTHQRIWQRILDLGERGEKVDRITVGEELQRHKELKLVGGLSYLISLDDGLPRLSDISSHAEIVREKSVRRGVIESAHRLYKRAFVETEPLEALFAEAAALGASFNGAGRAHEQPSAVPAWPVMSEDAFQGVAGELVRAIEPQTEADPAALLVQFLVGWGSLAGRGPYYLAEADHHHTNEYAVIVGTTAKGRKGTSWGRVLHVLRATDSAWARDRQLQGVASGEAIIEFVSESDRRALLIEGEFARLLAVASREGSIASAVLRSGWDTGTLCNNARTHKVTVDGAHVSMIGHITREELLRSLDKTETANGFGNRILWVCARRSKVLPFGGGSVECGDALRKISNATEFARELKDTRIGFDAHASTLWERVYGDLSEGRPGLFGSMTSRAEAHCVRLALLYALLDGAKEIRAEHLRAALAVWHYCEASARFIWGNSIGDPDADEILKALKAAGDDGMTRWDIVNHFSRNKKATDIDRAIGVLAERGLIRSEKEETGGRSSTRYRGL